MSFAFCSLDFTAGIRRWMTGTRTFSRGSACVFIPVIIACNRLIKLFCPQLQSLVERWLLCFLCLEITSCLIHKTPPSLKNSFLKKKKSYYYSSNSSFSIRRKISPCYHNKTLKIKLPLNFPKWPCTKHPGLADEKSINLLTLRHLSCAFPSCNDNDSPTTVPRSAALQRHTAAVSPRAARLREDTAPLSNSSGSGRAVPGGAHQQSQAQLR